MSRQEDNHIKQLTNKELLDEYNEVTNRIDGITDGGFGKMDLYYREELLRELNIREE